MRGHRPALTLVSVAPLFVTLALISPACAQSKSQPATPCRAYFTVLETDEVTVGLPMLGLNKPQLSWYEKHGDKGKSAGICYLDLTAGNKSQLSLAEFVSQEKSGALKEPDAPLYVITWGEALVTKPYVGTYQTQEQSQVNVTDQNGNTSSGTVTTPVTHTYSGTKRYYVADGVLQRWDVNTQSLIPVLPMHNHNRTIFTSASTSLLKDGLEAIRQRLDSGIEQATKTTPATGGATEASPPSESIGQPITGQFGGIVHNQTANISAEFGIVVQESDGGLSGCMIVKQPLFGSGPLTGVVDGSSVSFVVTSAVGKITFVGQRRGEAINGTYTVEHEGAPAQHGAFTLAQVKAAGSAPIPRASQCPTDAEANQ